MLAFALYAVVLRKWETLASSPVIEVSGAPSSLLNGSCQKSGALI